MEVIGTGRFAALAKEINDTNAWIGKARRALADNMPDAAFAFVPNSAYEKYGCNLGEFACRLTQDELAIYTQLICESESLQ